MAITDSEFLEKQQKYSKSISQIDTASDDDIANSVTLPGVLLDENGNPKKYIQTKMSVFSQPAIDAAAQCQSALQQLTTALSDVATALAEAQRIRTEMESATDAATAAANKASQDAQTAINNANTALSNAQTALADAQTALANAASSKQITDGLNSDLQGYLTQVSQLITTLQQSIASADDTANHPTYIGSDNYVYQWNKQTQTYTKTNIYVRGEGFHVSKEFHSVEEMEEYSGAGLKEGDFVLINTGDVQDPDNAKLYTYDGDGGYDFLVDMSGAIGFTGKTPQISIGTVTTLPAGSQASASLTADGEDSDGNPKYKLNLSLPKGDPFTYADFTAEQIAELQRPAMDAIALCEAATTAANTAASNANTATTNANNAAMAANDAATLANQKATLADQKATLANTAATDANNAATLANQKAELANTAAANADTATAATNQAISDAQTATSNATDAATLANQKATLADQKATAANTAAVNANTAATGAANVNATLSGTNITVTDRDGNSITQNIKGDKGDNLDWDSMTPEDKQELAQEVLATIGFDDVPTENSNKAVKSGGLYDAFEAEKERVKFASIETCRSIITELI